ncbi:hypothetical protein BaRGS_00010365, partial [Batillaria attramentaria]
PCRVELAVPEDAALILVGVHIARSRCFDMKVLLFIGCLALARLAAGQVRCDSTHECRTEQTCCKLASGNWGCCPVPNAVCCPDGIHCCRNGFTCKKSTCERGNQVVPMLERQPAFMRLAAGQVKCDSTHECQSGQTCCKLASGNWGCCPQPEAVCCSDHVHCCPKGFTCELPSHCRKGDDVVPWMEKVPAFVSENVKAVQCDSTHECPTGDTCCKLANGNWGCCPVKNAVCCADHVHCCPSGYKCETSTGRCTKGDNSAPLPWLVAISK